MKSKTFVFLNPFTIENPSREQQTDFLYEDMMASSALGKLGKVYDYRELPNTEEELKVFIEGKIIEEKPQWVVATDLSASVLAGIKIPNRILINPHISFADLNNVPEQVRQTTHGFFDESHESDYERFCSVYPNAMLSLVPEMDYDRIAPIIEGIINHEDDLN
ncbi:MAG: hypothetical protein J1F07_06610 [Muribaculaceae bacterium]|nr:hypothetical protein [Muribaculaceae bacterium]